MNQGPNLAVATLVNSVTLILMWYESRPALTVTMFVNRLIDLRWYESSPPPPPPP